jgi:hypothetical protein
VTRKRAWKEASVRFVGQVVKLTARSASAKSHGGF